MPTAAVDQRPQGERQRRSAGRQQARSAGPVPQRHVGDGPRDAESRRALGSLSRLDAGAAADRVHQRSGQRSGADVSRGALLHLELIGPRIGMTYDLAGDGKTVIKASYGLFWHNPGSRRQRGREPEPEQQERHLQLDRSQRRSPLPDGRTVVRSRRRHLPGRISSIPNIIAAVLARRHRFTWNARLHEQHWRARRLRLQVGRRLDRLRSTLAVRSSAYTCHSLAYVDSGARRASPAAAADDQTIADACWRAEYADVNTRFPVTNVAMNLDSDGRYKTIEASVNKRLSNRWSMQAGGSHTWSHEFSGAEQPECAPEEATPRAGTSSCRALTRRRTASGSRRSCVIRRARISRARFSGAGIGDSRRVAIFSGTIDAEPLDVPSPRQHHGVRRAGRPRLHSRSRHADPRALRSVQHHEQQRRRNADDHDRHGVPAPDGGARAADGSARRAASAGVVWHAWLARLAVPARRSGVAGLEASKADLALTARPSIDACRCLSPPFDDVMSNVLIIHPCFLYIHPGLECSSDARLQCPVPRFASVDGLFCLAVVSGLGDLATALDPHRTGGTR